MKTPENIKMGLKRCYNTGSCLEDCPYGKLDFPECVIVKCDDAIAYIQQLETDNAQLNRCIENLTDKLNATNDALPRWISVEDEQKPRHGQNCLCICALSNDPEHKWDWQSVRWWNATAGNGYVDRPHFSDEGVEGMTVTHWMPLPERPKEG